MLTERAFGALWRSPDCRALSPGGCEITKTKSISLNAECGTADNPPFRRGVAAGIQFCFQGHGTMATCRICDKLMMDLNLQYHPILGLHGKLIYVFKLAPNSLQKRWSAEDIVAKARSNLKGGDYVPDIVIMEGEPGDDPKLFGSCSCV